MCLSHMYTNGSIIISMLSKSNKLLQSSLLSVQIPNQYLFWAAMIGSCIAPPPCSSWPALYEGFKVFREMLRKRFTRKTTDLEGGYRATSHGHVDDSFNVKRPLLAPRYTRIYHTYNNCSLHDAVQTKFTHKIYSFILVPDVQNLDGAILSPANKCLKKVFRSFYSLIKGLVIFLARVGAKDKFFPS